MPWSVSHAIDEGSALHAASCVISPSKRGWHELNSVCAAWEVSEALRKSRSGRCSRWPSITRSAAKRATARSGIVYDEPPRRRPL